VRETVDKPIAAARSRAAEKITPVDQPGGCRSYLQGMPWRIRLTPCR